MSNTPLKSVKSNELYTNLSNGVRSFKDLALNTSNIEPLKSQIRSVHEHTVIDSRRAKTDDELLAEIGYKPELSRKFSTIQVFGIAFSIMGLLPSIASVLGQSFTTGASSAVWAWFIGGFFILLIGISMSEMASAIPTSGGLYYWTYHYAPDNLRIPLSFLVGNSNTVALTGALCSIDYGFAKELLSIVYIAKDGDFHITDGMTYGVYAACVISHVIIACAASGHIAKLQSFSIYSNLALIVFFIIAILVGTDDKNDASFIFGNINSSMTEWNVGWSWFFQGTEAVIWTIGAFDSCIHMSEEARNSARSVPIGIISSITVCWLLGWIILIVCSVCVNPELSPVVNSASGQPMAELIYDSLGKKWAISFMALIAACQWLMGASTLTAISRQAFAFARDNGLIFSSVVKVVNKKLKVPLRAVIFGGILALIMGLLCLIGSTAANALFTLYISGNYFSWQTPIMLRLYRSFSKDPALRFKPGVFYLGDVLSPLVSWITVLFTNFTIIMVMFPASPNVDKESMNYTVVITCGTWIFSMLYYYFYAYKTFFGPRNTLGDVDKSDEEEINTIEGKDALIDRIVSSGDDEKK